MLLEIHVLAWDRHKNVSALNRLMGSQLVLFDNHGYSVENLNEKIIFWPAMWFFQGMRAICVTYIVVLFVFSCFRWLAVIRFLDISRIMVHHSLNFLFKIIVYNLRLKFGTVPPVWYICSFLFYCLIIVNNSVWTMF
jgi:hypothetical protein